MHSYHVFYFPFRWSIKGSESKLFSEQIDLNKLPSVLSSSDWETDCVLSPKEEELMYNEKNYYYPFVHKVLYDTGGVTSLIKHYERVEPKLKDTYYIIETKDGRDGNGDKDDKDNKGYKLKLESINLNIYATGVGVLSFYVENSKYPNPRDILKINQYGRRIFPPYFDDLKYRGEVAKRIGIIGLNGEEDRYIEDFNNYTANDSWREARFITNLISDYSDVLDIKSVIDDRMYVNCSYCNDKLSQQISANIAPPILSKVSVANGGNKSRLNNTFDNSDFWYKYVFVDVNSITCQNDEMRYDLLKKSTYTRWQEGGTLYGCSRYSLVQITNESPFAKDVLSPHMRGIYSRLTELVLMQRASMLRFSDEVSQISHLKSAPHLVAPRVSSLYKEYIRFMNQFFFREVTTQDQGVELYTMLNNQFNSQEQIKELDKELEELHSYVSLLTDEKRNENSHRLNIIAMIFLPATLVSGIFGMNQSLGFDKDGVFIAQIGCIIIFTAIMWILYNRIKK